MVTHNFLFSANLISCCVLHPSQSINTRKEQSRSGDGDFGIHPSASWCSLHARLCPRDSMWSYQRPNCDDRLVLPHAPTFPHSSQSHPRRPPATDGIGLRRTSSSRSAVPSCCQRARFCTCAYMGNEYMSLSTTGAQRG